MATGNPRKRRPAPSPSPSGLHAGEMIKQYVADIVAEKVAEKTEQQVAKIDAKLERLGPVYDALDLWTRSEPGARRPRFSLDEIATAAIRIADTEGIDALSM